MRLKNSSSREIRKNLLSHVFIISTFLLLNTSQAGAQNSISDFGQAVVEKYEETSKPVFDPNAKEQKETLARDPFFDKLRKDQQKFSKKQHKRRVDFSQKISKEDLSDPNVQQKILKFNQKEMKRTQKFTAKQQKKVEKHREEES